MRIQRLKYCFISTLLLVNSLGVSATEFSPQKEVQEILDTIIELSHSTKPTEAQEAKFCRLFKEYIDTGYEFSNNLLGRFQYKTSQANLETFYSIIPQYACMKLRNIIPKDPNLTAKIKSILNSSKKGFIATIEFTTTGSRFNKVFFLIETLEDGNFLIKDILFQSRSFIRTLRLDIQRYLRQVQFKGSKDPLLDLINEITQN